MVEEPIETKLRKQRSHYSLWLCYNNMKAVRISFFSNDKRTVMLYAKRAGIFFSYVEI